MNVTEIDKSVKDLFAKSKLGGLKNTYLGVYLLNSLKNLVKNKDGWLSNQQIFEFNTF